MYNHYPKIFRKFQKIDLDDQIFYQNLHNNPQFSKESRYVGRVRYMISVQVHGNTHSNVLRHYFVEKLLIWDKYVPVKKFNQTDRRTGSGRLSLSIPTNNIAR